MSELTPREIVSELDKYIIGQKEAKKAVAIALEDDYVSYKYIRQLCEQIDFANKSTGKSTLGASDQAPKFTVCENIRGNYE